MTAARAGGRSHPGQPGGNGADVEQAREQPTEASQTGPVRILVVDDEPLARQTFTDLLEAHGFDVVSVARGEEAFGFLDQVDLVLLDAMLPGRDGWSICRDIKEHHDALLPIIMVTARTAPDDVVRTFSAGADDYVAKPFHVAELTARIESRLRVHRAELALKRANDQLRELADQNYELYEQARHDAEERSLLLRELDHRVRNNLSVIMGLLGMERNRRPPRAPAEALASLEHRMRSFLLVHEALRRQNYAGVPAREIADKLAQRLRNAWDVERHIDLEISGASLILDERRGFALALILNELLTNALRHAFPNGREGTIRLRFEHEQRELRMVVEDDGVGSSMERTPGVTGSGMSIVTALVRNELGGEVRWDATPGGTNVVVAFPESPGREPGADEPVGAASGGAVG